MAETQVVAEIEPLMQPASPFPEGYFDELFDCNGNFIGEDYGNPDVEELLSLDEDAFFNMVQEDIETEVKKSLDNVVEKVVENLEFERLQLSPITRSDSLASLQPLSPISRSDSFEPLIPTNSLDAFPLDNAITDEPADLSVFDSDTEETESEASEAETEPESECESECSDIQCELEAKDMEIARLRAALERKRSRDDDVEEIRPQKRFRSFEAKRRGCPFCPFEQGGSGYDMRRIKDHMTNGDCVIDVMDMEHSTCTHENIWCDVGDNGWDCLSKMGFKDPSNFVREFRRFECPKCDFTHFHARKFERHLKAGKNRGGCGFSALEAKYIKDEQLKRKITACI